MEQRFIGGMSEEEFRKTVRELIATPVSAGSSTPAVDTERVVYIFSNLLKEINHLKTEVARLNERTQGLQLIGGAR